jgi:DNA repair protein RecO (recombination protein O)
METLKMEGIVIRAVPYRNDDCILTVFTPLQGLIPLFLRSGYKSKKHVSSGALSPLSVVEIVCTKGRGELYPCQEIAVVRHHLKLRENLAMLESACRMLQMIGTTQQPDKSAPELYQLLLVYLDRLPEMSSPDILSHSFYLKLLRYEGIFPLLSHCSICSVLLQDTWLHANEPFCLPHAPVDAMHLSPEERHIMESLAYCRDFKQLSSLVLSPQLSQKIHSLQFVN